METRSIQLTVTGLAVAAMLSSGSGVTSARDRSEVGRRVAEVRHRRSEKTLYVWAGDQERARPDFLAVIDFNEHSHNYGRVLRTVPLPPPGNVGNEPHHCHLSADKNILACGGLLSVLSGQNGVFFFDVSNARKPEFLFSTSAPTPASPTTSCPCPAEASW
jgi:hypothetical protein